VRPANAYGVQQPSRTGQGFLAAAIDATLSGREIEIYGEVGTVRDYVHVSDVASGIIAALDFGGDGETYNIGTGIGFSNMDVIDILRPLVEATGRTVLLRHLPSRRFDVEANVLDAQKLRSASGWRPYISLQCGLAEMWDNALATSSTL
jgi:UDP-glucose 4-epimerase